LREYGTDSELIILLDDGCYICFNLIDIQIMYIEKPQLSPHFGPPTKKEKKKISYTFHKPNEGESIKKIPLLSLTIIQGSFISI
jgi:hypothetical protein